MLTEQEQQKPTNSTPPRRWIRYRGTYVVMAMTFIVLLLANYVGRIEPELNIASHGQTGAEAYLSEHCVHGWPCTYLQRNGYAAPTPIGIIAPWRLSELHPWEGIRDFSLGPLVTDVFLALLLTGLTGVCYEAWRRRRTRLFQITLGDLFLLLTLLAVLAAYYAAHRAVHAREMATLHRLYAKRLQVNDDEEDPPQFASYRQEWADSLFEVDSLTITWQRGGSQCLRDRLGDWPFAPFDRIVGLHLGGAEVVELADLKNLQHLDVISGEFGVPEGRVLEHLPQLASIHSHFGTWNPPAPLLPKLRMLSLFEGDCHSRGLLNLPALEILDLSFSELHGDVLGVLQGSPRLQYLLLSQTKIGDEELARLPNLPELRDLALDDNPITDRSLPVLKRLTSLRELSLQNCELSATGLAELRQALPNCEIHH